MEANIPHLYLFTLLFLSQLAIPLKALYTHLTMDERIEQLGNFLQQAPRRLRVVLGEGDFFDLYLEDAYDCNELDHLLDALKAAEGELLKLKPNDPSPPQWIDYNKPLVSESGLADIIMEWKKEHDLYNFEALRCYVLARCFQPVS